MLLLIYNFYKVVLFSRCDFNIFFYFAISFNQFLISAVYVKIL